MKKIICRNIEFINESVNIIKRHSDKIYDIPQFEEYIIKHNIIKKGMIQIDSIFNKCDILKLDFINKSIQVKYTNTVLNIAGEYVDIDTIKFNNIKKLIIYF